MLRYYINKILVLCVLYLFINTGAVASEPTLASLVNVISNDIQRFKINNYQFNCEPYGIITLEELYKESSFDTVCKKSIYEYFTKRPDLTYFVAKKMHTFQLYNIKVMGEKCIVNIDGEKSLSEVLLEEGLAVRKPLLRNEEYHYYFYKSELKAKISRKGIWESNIMKECIADIYKKK